MDGKRDGSMDGKKRLSPSPPTSDLRAGVRDADEAREDVLGQDVRVALLRQVVRVDVNLKEGEMGQGGGGGEGFMGWGVRCVLLLGYLGGVGVAREKCDVVWVMYIHVCMIKYTDRTCCVRRWRLVAETARTRHSVLPAKDCCSYWEVVVTKISSLCVL